MERIALIGENSVEYINMLVDIWNSGNCAVLVDCQIPPQATVEMMCEAQVTKCYVEHKYYEKICAVLDETIELISYEKENASARLLPAEIYDRFQDSSQCAGFVFASLGDLFYKNHLCSNVRYGKILSLWDFVVIVSTIPTFSRISTFSAKCLIKAVM